MKRESGNELPVDRKKHYCTTRLKDCGHCHSVITSLCEVG